MIWSKAKELLDCDILRIIGCSLNRNDWELISLLYTTQSLRNDGKTYEIELIDCPKSCKNIKNNYTYLRLKNILEIPVTRDYLIQEYFPQHVGKPIVGAVLNELEENVAVPKYNIFEIWLRSIGEKMLDDGKKLDTKKGYIKKFIEEYRE
jgi:hypothetical protein